MSRCKVPNFAGRETVFLFIAKRLVQISSIAGDIVSSSCIDGCDTITHALVRPRASFSSFLVRFYFFSESLRIAVFPFPTRFVYLYVTFQRCFLRPSHRIPPPPPTITFPSLPHSISQLSPCLITSSTCDAFTTLCDKFTSLVIFLLLTGPTSTFFGPFRCSSHTRAYKARSYVSF